jgi:hypothetical protein
MAERARLVSGTFVATYWYVIALCGGAVGLLVVLGLASLWAEAGGKPRLPRDDEEDPEEKDGLDGRRRATQRRQPDEAEGPAEDDVPPWEQPGAVRRDCEPDRGPQLVLLGRLSLWLIAVGLIVGAVVLLATVPIAIVVLTMASRDRAKMRAGTMDPAGEPLARKGVRYATAALVVSVLALLGVGCLVVTVIASAAG